jgi:adenosylcobinamide-phosphate synthase
MSALLTIIAVLLDAALGEPRRWHPLVGFGRWARYLERRLHAAAQRSAFALRLRGVVAVLLAVTPWVLLVAVSVTVPMLRCVADVAVLYFALGHQSLRQHALRVHQALQAGNLDEARGRIAFMVSRDTGKMNAQAVAAATVESVLENGNDAVFAALFWFLLAGAPGVLLYRLANTLDAMWGYRTPQYLYFGWAAARFDDVLNFAPARLTALTYAMIGRTGSALRCWRSQARAWESPNAGPVMAAGAGALGVGLGGGAYYHGHWKERPPLGAGPAPDAESIPAALRLVRSGVVLWLLIVIAVEIVAHA